MRRTLFRPELDRLTFVPGAQVAEQKVQELRKTIYDAVPDAISKLNTEFGLYKNVFKVESCCKQQIVPHMAEKVSLEAGIETATLDYFEVRMPRVTPRKKSHSLEPNKEEKEFEDFLFNRTAIFLKHNAADILVWRTVLLSVPASPVTEQIFLTPIRTSLQKQSDFFDSDCRLTLAHQVPDGLAWQVQRCRQELSELKRRINHGQPVLVVLINKSNNDADCDVVIAYAYEEISLNVIDIEVCVASDLVFHGSIRLDLSGSKSGILALRAWQDHGSWSGFFCARYEADIPPLSRGQKWRRYFYPLRLWWWIKRRFYLYVLVKRNKPAEH